MIQFLILSKFFCILFDHFFDNPESREISFNKYSIIALKSLSRKYHIRENIIDYMVSLIDKHGIDILRTSKNKEHPKYEKEEAINRVLINGEAVWAVAIDMGLLSYGMLQNWIKKYKENGYNIVERKRGRPTMPKVRKNRQQKKK